MSIPPILQHDAPWKQRFRAPYVAWTQLARLNPSRGLATTTISGQYQLYAWDVPTGSLRQLTTRLPGVPFGSISPDGSHVYYLDDDNGNEMGHFVRLAFDGGPPRDITPGMKPYSAFGISSSRSGNLLGSTISDDSGFHTLVIPASGDGMGPPQQIHHSDKIMFGPSLSSDGTIGVITSREHSQFQHYCLIAVKTANGERIEELWDQTEGGLWPHGFSPLDGDYNFLGISNRSGYSRPFIWNPLTGERKELPMPDLPGDITPLDWSADGQRLLISQSSLAVQKLFVYMLSTGELRPLDHPGGYYGMGTAFGPGGEIYGQWQDPTHPPRLIVLNGETGRYVRTALTAGEVPTGHPWHHITLTSVDGEKIQGWLGLPDGKGPFPTILHTHGGPETQTVEYFLPASQTWLDHGYAWLAINYRGSTGFGREFREKIWGNLGHWEVEDMVAARRWLIESNISLPDKVLLTGWSYGGYLTCLALGLYPDLWAGGMAGTATVDWALEYEDLSPAMRGYSVAVMGGTPQEKPEQYALSSPMHYVNNVKAPLLIIQGRNDTRTPARPVEVYEARMKQLGKKIEVHWYDEGHFGGGVEQDIDQMEVMLKFAYRITR